jgi:hypothetical protein
MTIVHQTQPEPPQQRKKRGSYKRQFVRDPANKPVELPFLQERDIEILKEVHENWFLTFSLIHELFPPLPVHAFDPNSQRQQKLRKKLIQQGLFSGGVPEAQAQSEKPKATGYNLYSRLRKLYHFYYLQRLHTYRDEERIYALDAKGAKRLEKEGIKVTHVEDWNEKNRDISQRYYNHVLFIARFYVALKVALRNYPTLILKKFVRGKKACLVTWDTSIDGKKYPKKIVYDPDIFVVLHDLERNGDRGFVVEADRSTESDPVFLEKLTRCSLMFDDEAHVQKYQLRNIRSLTICKSKERAAILHGLPFRKDLARPYTSHVPKNYFIPEDNLPRFYFATETDYTHALQNVLASIWHRADEPWMRKDNSENTRGIVPDPLPLVKNV